MSENVHHPNEDVLFIIFKSSLCTCVLPVEDLLEENQTKENG